MAAIRQSIWESSFIRRTGFIFFLALILIPRPAESIDPENPLSNRLVEEWNSSRELPSDFVYCLEQTPDGYLWIGTQRGLVRNDGIRHETLLHEAVYDLCAGRDGALWVCLGNELLRYQYGRFIPIRPRGGSVGIAAISIFEDMKGDLWIGYYNGVLGRLRNGAYMEFKLPADNEFYSIMAIEEDVLGTLWIGTNGDGLFKGRDGIFSRYDIGRSPDYSVFRIHEDRSGSLWAATNIGLVRIRDNRAGILRYRDGLPASYVMDILEDGDGNLWCSTGGGLCLIRRDAGGVYRATSPILTNQVVGPLFEDRERNLWVAIPRHGLKCFKNVVFRTLAEEVGIPSYSSAVFTSRDGSVWIGDQIGRLYRMKNGRAYQVLNLGLSPEAGILSMAEDSRGCLWLGTTSRGVFKVENGTVVSIDAGRPLPFVRTILSDSRNRLWIGFQNGLVCLRDGVFRTYATADKLPGNLVFNVLEDRGGRLWIATNVGLTVLKNGEWDPGGVETILCGKAIMTLFEDEDRVLWAGTYGGGLVRVRNNEMTHFGRKEGLGSDIISQIQDDCLGFLWLNSPDGVIKVAKASLRDDSQKTHRGVDCIVYGKSDGVRGEGPNYSTQNSITRTPTGELWFAMDNGISIVHPEKIKVNRFLPMPVLTRIFFNHEEVPLDRDKASFKGVRDIQFDFAAPAFISPERVRLRYKLEGVDSDWRTVGAFGEKSAEYKNLPFGSFRFRIAACNSDNIWNENNAVFDFSLKPYIHQTWPFKAGVSVLALVVGLLAYSGLHKFLEQRRLKRKYRNSTLDSDKAEDYLKNLIRLFEEEKVFKSSNLSLQSLSKRLGVSPRDLSRIINERLNRNFWALVNSYRIEEARSMIRASTNGDSTILGIALDVGFNSLAAFNRAFKKFTGMTPSHYKKTNSRAEDPIRDA